MTTLNEIINGPTTVAFSGYNSGSFDCRGSNALVKMTLTPTSADGVPANNQSTVYGSFGGLVLTMADDNPDTAAGTELVYWDASNDQGGQMYSGPTHLVLQNSKAAIDINQLLAGTGDTLAKAQAIGVANPSLTAGACVYEAGGSWVALNPALPSPVSIEASIKALSFVNVGSASPFGGNLEITVDLALPHQYVIRDVTVGPVSCAFVTPSNSDGPGLLLWPITAAGLSPHGTLSADGNYLTFK